MQDDGAEGFILDLRNNPGGLVRAGLDIARLFMEGPSAIFNVQGRIDSSAANSIMQVCLYILLNAMAALLNCASAAGTCLHVHQGRISDEIYDKQPAFLADASHQAHCS